MKAGGEHLRHVTVESYQNSLTITNDTKTAVLLMAPFVLLEYV